MTVKGIIKKMFLANRKRRISLFKTVLVNFYCLDIKCALHFPIYIYRGTRIFDLNKITIKARTHRGMIRIGQNYGFETSYTSFNNSGEIIFNGRFNCISGTKIWNSGVLELGDKVDVRQNCEIRNHLHIKLGNGVVIGYGSKILDTDYHYVIDTKSHETHRNSAPVILEDDVWVSSYCKIYKGSHLPKGSILGAASMLRTDFSSEPPFTFFGGHPAKPLKRNKRRIFNTIVEEEIDSYFKSHPEEDSLIISNDQYSREIHS